MSGGPPPVPPPPRGGAVVFVGRHRTRDSDFGRYWHSAFVHCGETCGGAKVEMKYFYVNQEVTDMLTRRRAQLLVPLLLMVAGAVLLAIAAGGGGDDGAS